MNHLSSEGQELFNAFNSATKAWSDYIVPIALKAFNDRLTSLGKKHSKLDGMAIFDDSPTSSKLSSASSNDISRSNADCKAIYKKLALIFHPDKFAGPDEIFKQICAYVSVNDYKSLLSFHQLIETLNLDEMDDAMMEKLLLLVKSPELLKPNLDDLSSSSSPSSQSSPVDGFDAGKIARNVTRCLDHDAYRWFIGDARAKELYESMYLTDDELIQTLKNAPDNRLHFYMKLCSDNVKILEAIYDIMQHRMQKCRAENDRLKTMYAKTLGDS